MSSEEIEDILQGVQVGDVKDFDAHILRAAFAHVTARAEAAEAALATARAEGAAAERAAVVRMLGKYRDHAEKLGLAAESVVLAEVLEVIDSEAHFDQMEGA
jgi:hypothetical protein